ncbi:MAG: penicillin-binding transpeptidase domain-containing protein, partial [Bacteroidota bacterium]
CNYYKAKKVAYDVQDGEWSPSNDDADYEGKYTMEGALEESVNTIAVKILEDVGIETTIEMAGKMGIASTLPEVPSLALGTASISLLEMVTAYSGFVNGGLRINPYMIERIEDKNGNILYQRKEVKGERILDERTSRMMIHMLEGVVDDGTARSIRTRYSLQNHIGGKTGTTQNNADGWFLAVTPKLVAGVWTGGIYPEISFTETRLGQGATMALPVFAGFYQKLNKNASYTSVTNASFKPIKEEWEKELDCDPFKEDFRFFEWLFGKDQDEKDDRNLETEEKEGFMKKLGDIFKKKKKN